MRRAGAITVGKTNTPEFGSGSQTFNKVFGATHNPYDLTKTCGGSSGGAAVALACGLVPLASGSDTGGVTAKSRSILQCGWFSPFERPRAESKSGFRMVYTEYLRMLRAFNGRPRFRTEHHRRARLSGPAFN
jgi:hypothetical protein